MCLQKFPSRQPIKPARPISSADGQSFARNFDDCPYPFVSPQDLLLGDENQDDILIGGSEGDGVYSCSFQHGGTQLTSTQLPSQVANLDCHEPRPKYDQRSARQTSRWDEDSSSSSSIATTRTPSIHSSRSASDDFSESLDLIVSLNSPNAITESPVGSSTSSIVCPECSRSFDKRWKLK